MDITNEPENNQEIRVLEEGPLEGAALASFLERLDGNEIVSIQSKPQVLAKAAERVSCRVDFDDYWSLSAIPKHANSFYALAPYYSEPCPSDYKAYAIPSKGSYYYLVPDDGTVPCTGSGDNFGTWNSGFRCVDQYDAALKPRMFSNGSTTDGDLANIIYMMNGNNTPKNFDLQAITLKAGKVIVYGYRVGIGWWWWGMLAGPNTYAFPTTAQNLSQIRFIHQDNNGVYKVDNIELLSVN